MSLDAPPRLWTDVPLHVEALKLLAANFRLGGPGVPADFSSANGLTFADADAAIVGARLPFDAAAFAGAPRLKVVARTGIGYDNVDVAAATAAGICALNTPDAPTESTAEFAIGLMFAVARRIAAADRNAKEGHWRYDPSVMGFDLAEKTLGLVGFGRIARRVAEMARAIRMRVQAFDPFVPPEQISALGASPCISMEELLAGARILSLHVPASPSTHHLIGAAQLARLPRGAILINTARGPLIEEAAVLAALESGHLAGAGLDVWEPEPTSPENPLWLHPRVVATPHIAAYTEEGRRRSHVTAAQHVICIFRGEAPPTLLDRAVWAQRRT